jgi:hypothetical protein
MRYWHHVETQEHGPFSVVLDWTYEDAPIESCFDETVEDFDKMRRRLNDGTDTHYVARVRVMYDGVEMGEETLGSCYAYGCEPEDDMKAGIGGYLEDMIAEAMEQAQTRSLEMLDRLKRDFLGVDSQMA